MSPDRLTVLLVVTILSSSDVTIGRTSIAAAGETPGATRKWTDKSGTYSVEAELLGVQDGSVLLKRHDGHTVKVHLDVLSPQDQEYVRQKTTAASKREVSPGDQGRGELSKAAMRLITQAIKAAGAIGDPGDRLTAHLSVSSAQVSLSDMAAARTSIERAKEVIGVIEKPSERIGALTQIVNAQIAASDLVGAESTLKALEQLRTQLTAHDEKSHADGAISGLYATLHTTRGDYRNAHQVVSRMDDEVQKAWALAEIAKAQLASRDLAAASETVQQIPTNCPMPLQSAVARQIEAGDMPGAQRTADRLRGTKDKEQLDHYFIFKILVATGDLENARLIAPRLRNWDRDMAYARLAEANAAQGKPVATNAMIEHITRDQIKSNAYLNIAESHIKAGRWKVAITAAASIPAESKKGLAFAKIAMAQVESGDKAGALESLRLAEQTAASANDDEDRIATRCEIAEVTAQRGEVENALAMAMKISDLPGRTRAYAYISAVQFVAGNKAGGHRTLAMAEGALAQIPDPSDRCRLAIKLSEDLSRRETLIQSAKPSQAKRPANDAASYAEGDDSVDPSLKHGLAAWKMGHEVLAEKPKWEWLRKNPNARSVRTEGTRRLEEYFLGDKLVAKQVTFMDDTLVGVEQQVIRFAREAADEAVDELIEELGPPHARLAPPDAHDTIRPCQWDFPYENLFISCSIGTKMTTDGVTMYYFQQFIGNKKALGKK